MPADRTGWKSLCSGRLWRGAPPLSRLVLASRVVAAGAASCTPIQRAILFPQFDICNRRNYTSLVMASCRFAFAVHILAVLAYKEGVGATSELLGRSVNTNPVVVRRILSELRRAGLVLTHKGAGGGARLSRPPQEISLAEIYRAVEHGPSFSMHPHPPNPRCPVGHKIEAVLAEVFTAAQEALARELDRRTLAELLETVVEKNPEHSVRLTEMRG